VYDIDKKGYNIDSCNITDICLSFQLKSKFIDGLNESKSYILLNEINGSFYINDTMS